MSRAEFLKILAPSSLAIAAVAVAQPRPAPETAEASGPKIDRTVMHVQVILDHLGFSPGVIDGLEGESLTSALRGFQTLRGLDVTGEIDQATLRALYPYRAWRPTRTLAISDNDARGPFTWPFPSEPEDQAKLDRIGYRNMLERLAEKFHTTPETLIALNSPQTVLRAGERVVFPNALPTSRAYNAGDEKWEATLSMLNVDANQPQGERIVVDKSDEALRVYDAANRLVAQFPATMGSTHDPLPLGEWTIKGVARNPPFNYNPDLFWDADPGDTKLHLPPGPNGPVGVVWIDLSKPHYGIHGTSEPQTIGRAESHGCIRLTNWDAARLALIVKPGMPALFQA